MAMRIGRRSRKFTRHPRTGKEHFPFPRVKVFLPIFATLVASALAPLRADLLVQPHDRLLVGCEVPLDQGMVSVDLAAYFLMCQPVDGLAVIGANQGEENVEGFMRRVPTEIAAWSPTVVITSHGIDDGRVGKDDKDYTFYHPTYLQQQLDALKKIGVRSIILGSASAVDSSLPQGAIPAKTYNDNLAAFRDLDRDIAAKAGVPFVDIFGATFDVMNKAKAAFGDSYNFGGDRGRFLHRNAQLVMAWAFLKALGADGNIGTITVDLAANTATGTPGQKIVSVQKGTVNVESTRYPYCFTTSPPYNGVDVTSDIITLFPFNQDLNRYLLVVKGLTAPRVKVTWGAESRVFAAGDLAQGVNLAAAFAGHTPFDNVFGHVVDALWQQQLKQFIWNDSVIAHMDALKQMAPGAPFDQLIAGIHDQDAKNDAAAAALMVPIAHTIKIEPQP
jgi:hypothetical protein